MTHKGSHISTLLFLQKDLCTFIFRFLDYKDLVSFSSVMCGPRQDPTQQLSILGLWIDAPQREPFNMCATCYLDRWENKTESDGKAKDRELQRNLRKLFEVRNKVTRSVDMLFIASSIESRSHAASLLMHCLTRIASLVAHSEGLRYLAHRLSVHRLVCQVGSSSSSSSRPRPGQSEREGALQEAALNALDKLSRPLRVVSARPDVFAAGCGSASCAADNDDDDSSAQQQNHDDRSSCGYRHRCEIVSFVISCLGASAGASTSGRAASGEQPSGTPAVHGRSAYGGEFCQQAAGPAPRAEVVSFARDHLCQGLEGDGRERELAVAIAATTARRGPGSAVIHISGRCPCNCRSWAG